jgi:Zn-dependent protease with chaperone function
MNVAEVRSLPMRSPALLLPILLLAACGAAYEVPLATAPTASAAAPAVAAGAPAGRARTTADFSRVAARAEPAAERVCREENPRAPAAWCDFRIRLDTNPRNPPNAYQSEGEDGRPNVTVGVTLLGEMRSDDEIAFVLSHEMSHHIAGHLPKQQQQQMLGALILGGLVAAAGNPMTGGPASDQAISQAMDVGAYLGARSYSQTYELEADTLGAFIAARAGYDPERGAQIFARPALADAGGPPILSSHPASARRQATIAAVAAEIRRQQALGQTPSPAQAG